MRGAEQLLQNRSRRHVYADEGRSHAERAIKAGVQRKCGDGKRIYRGQLHLLGQDGHEDIDPVSGRVEAMEISDGADRGGRRI